MYRANLRCSQALARCALPIELIDGCVLQMLIDKVAQLENKTVIEGESMPDGKGGCENPLCSTTSLSLVLSMSILF